MNTEIEKLIEEYRKTDKFHDKMRIVVKIMYSELATPFLYKEEQVVKDTFIRIHGILEPKRLKVHKIQEEDNRFTIVIVNLKTNSFIDLKLVDEVSAESLVNLISDVVKDPIDWPPTGFGKKITIYSKEYWEGVE